MRIASHFSYLALLGRGNIFEMAFPGMPYIAFHES